MRCDICIIRPNCSEICYEIIKDWRKDWSKLDLEFITRLTNSIIRSTGYKCYQFFHSKMFKSSRSWIGGGIFK